MVKADRPRLKIGDIDLELLDGYLTLKVERKYEGEDKKEY